MRIALATLLFAGLSLPAFSAGPVPRPSPEFAVKMVPSGQTLISQYKGKAVCLAFISTTCPHCQKLTPVLSKMQQEYGPKGLQVVAAAFNPMANMYVPDFQRQFKPDFPLGWATREAVLEYLQHSAMQQLYVPILVFIDKDGVIREQHLGDDMYLQREEANIRTSIENILKSGKKTTQRRTSGAAVASAK